MWHIFVFKITAENIFRNHAILSEVSHAYWEIFGYFGH